MAVIAYAPVLATPSSETTKASFQPTRKQIATAASFIAFHVLLAVLMKATPSISTAHAVVTLGGGLVYAISTKRVRNLAMVAGYIAGCEVLWRMTSANVFWEFGKYAITAVLFIGVLRIRSRRNRVTSLMYFGLLLPSVALSLSALDLETARQEISFNLSGPLTLTVAVLFFSRIRLAWRELLGVFSAVAAPVVGVATLAILSTAAQRDLEFVNAASSVTSGGYGPNQVSAVLGLVVMFLLLVVMERRITWTLRVPMLLLAAVLATQSALTFSRGGIASALTGVAVAMFVLLRGNPRGRLTVILIAATSFLLARYVIEPQLETLTKGEIDERYTSTKSSGRDLFISSELEIFSEHPVLGVGPGVGMQLREERGLFYGASHTEYSRMLAEHGILGLIAIICLIVLGYRAIRDAREPHFKAAAAAMVIWVAIFLLIYGTRLAAPAFVFGLAFALRPAPKPPLHPQFGRG